MKKTNVLFLAAAAAAVLATGCSSMNGERTTSTGAGPAVSTLSFVPSTDPVTLTRWPTEWQQNLRSIDIYNFAVPEKGAAGGAPAYSSETGRGAAFSEAAGADATYYNASGRRVIRYSPSSH